MHDPTQTPCIVVADDESGTRTLLGKLLTKRGYEVLEASDGEEALTLAVSRPVDLLLCDLQMPKMRGEELGRWVQQVDPDVPIVFMTAYPSYESLMAALRCRAADYIEKPFRSLDVVVTAVEQALQRRDEARARRGNLRNPDEQDRVDELKRRFVSGVAHELRTPVTVIRSLVQVLARGVHGPLTREQAEILDHVIAETGTFAHEIDKLLSLARLENSDFTPDARSVPVADILDPIERPLRFRAAERRISLAFDVKDRELAVYADAQDIARALHALIENALKFTPEGGRVIVRIAPNTGPDQGVHFEVRDNGIGIDPADHGRIFEAFSQVESPLTRHHGGCGIGLTYAGRIVAAHGGRIRLRSRLGDGASFAFVLPYAPEPATESRTLEMRRGA